MKRFMFGILGLMLLCGNSFANETVEDGESGGKLPRMVVLRSNLINARSGPGSRYPIEWVYSQKDAPIEITAEFELWRKIKDWDGSESWVHKSMLSSSKRTVKVTSKGENNLYNKADSKSKIIAKVEDGVVGEIKRCPEESAFCQIRFDDITGWLPRTSLFGLYNKEVIE